jgi:CheY-like chemotaxis protein
LVPDRRAFRRPILLLDQMMPEMDGFALLEELRDEPAIAPATIMILTRRIDRTPVRRPLNRPRPGESVASSAVCAGPI